MPHELTLAERLEEITVTITRGDLERLDKMITLFDAMAGLFSDDMFDDAWNLRNGMVPFEPGHEHYGPESDE